jgi:hypothetical protein
MVLICSTLASRLLWLCTTPFGLPSEPEVKDHRRVFRLLLNLRQTRRQQMSKNPQLVAG